MTIWVPRAAWGARPAIPGGNKFSPPILGKGVHWEAAPPPANHDDCDNAVREIQNFHMNVRGWNDVAYNAIACNHGRLFQGRIGGTAANGTNFGNEHFPAVCWLGGPGHAPTDAALGAIFDATELLHIPADTPTYPHNHFVATACPGPALTAWCKAGGHDPAKPKPPLEKHFRWTGLDGVLSDPKRKQEVFDWIDRHQAEGEDWVGQVHFYEAPQT